MLDNLLPWQTWILFGTIGLIFGFVIGFLIPRKKKKKNNIQNFKQLKESLLNSYDNIKKACEENIVAAKEIKSIYELFEEIDVEVKNGNK